MESRSSAASITERTASTDGALTRFMVIRGGLAFSATFSRIHPQRTAWWSADEMMPWWIRIVFGDRPSSFIWPYRSSKFLTVSWVSLTFAIGGGSCVRPGPGRS